MTAPLIEVHQDHDNQGLVLVWNGDYPVSITWEQALWLMETLQWYWKGQSPAPSIKRRGHE